MKFGTIAFLLALASTSVAYGEDCASQNDKQDKKVSPNGETTNPGGKAPAATSGKDQPAPQPT